MHRKNPFTLTLIPEIAGESPADVDRPWQQHIRIKRGRKPEPGRWS